MGSRKSFLKKAASMFSLGWFFIPQSNASAASRKHKSAISIEPLIGQIALLPYHTIPDGWAECKGQLLQIEDYTALFSLLGTAYGGDGATTFGLPDLRGRAVMGIGQGPGLTTRSRGEQVGSETHQLTVDELPAHSHSPEASSNAGTSHAPSGNVHAANRDGILHYGSNSDVNMASSGISSTGNGQAHNNMQPSLVMTFCIATQGAFPEHN